MEHPLLAGTAGQRSRQIIPICVSHMLAGTKPMFVHIGSRALAYQGPL
jgi:hypothetical protein